MSQLFSGIDSLLSWLERTKWGRELIAFAMTIGWNVLAQIQEQPASILILGSVVIAVLVIEVLVVLPQYLRTRLGPPIYVSIDSVALIPLPRENQLFDVVITPAGIESALTVSIAAEIYALNRSRKRRVSLRFPTVRLTSEFTLLGGLSLQNVVANLGPEESTQGTVTVQVVGPMSRSPYRRELLIVDDVSQRRAWVAMPGEFPPGRASRPQTVMRSGHDSEGPRST